MGRKVGALRVNPKKLARNNMACLDEMMVFLACLKKFNFDDDQCKKQKDALNACVELQARAGKPRSTINYHLQKMSKNTR